MFLDIASIELQQSGKPRIDEIGPDVRISSAINAAGARAIIDSASVCRRFCDLTPRPPWHGARLHALCRALARQRAREGRTDETQPLDVKRALALL